MAKTPLRISPEFSSKIEFFNLFPLSFYSEKKKLYVTSIFKIKMRFQARISPEF